MQDTEGTRPTECLSACVFIQVDSHLEQPCFWKVFVFLFLFLSWTRYIAILWWFSISSIFTMDLQQPTFQSLYDNKFLFEFNR